MTNRRGKLEAVTDFISLESKVTADSDGSCDSKRCLSLEGSYDEPRQRIKKQRHCLAKTGPYSQSCYFSSSHVWMWELDHKEGWVPKNWCFQTVVLEKTLEGSLDCKKIIPVNPKGNQAWIFIRTDAKVEALTLWSPDRKRWPIGIDPDAGKDGRQKEKGATKGEMVR